MLETVKYTRIDGLVPARNIKNPVYTLDDMVRLVRERRISGCLYEHTTYVDPQDLDAFRYIHTTCVTRQEAARIARLSTTKLRSLEGEKKIKPIRYRNHTYYNKMDIINLDGADEKAVRLLDMPEDVKLKEFERYKSLRASDIVPNDAINMRAAQRLLGIERSMDVSLPYYLAVQHVYNGISIYDLSRNFRISDKTLRDFLLYFGIPLSSENKPYKKADPKKIIEKEFDRVCHTASDESELAEIISRNTKLDLDLVQKYLNGILKIK